MPMKKLESSARILLRNWPRYSSDRRTMERRKAMTTLKYMTRDGTFTLWDEHFKAILLILLETLGDNDPEIRSMALRVMGEIW